MFNLTEENHSYLFDVFLAPSHGRGVFTREFIPKGALVWIEKPEFLAEMSQEVYLGYEFNYFVVQESGTGRYVLSLDIARFENHSDDPNIKFDGHDKVYAIRDILPGEELLGNYKDYDLRWREKLEGITPEEN